jgi:hypothetical protein
MLYESDLSNVFSGAKTIYRTVVISVVMYCSEVWKLCKSDENSSAVWERKIMRRILGSVKENGEWRIRTDKEFVVLCREPDDISEIRKGRLQWSEHVVTLPEEKTAKKFLRISQMETFPLESQEGDDWPMLKII